MIRAHNTASGHGDAWSSEFPDKHGNRRAIVRGSGQATVTADKSYMGGHSALYLEYIDEMGFATVKKLHLMTNDGNDVELLDEEKHCNEESDVRGGHLHYTGYPMSDTQRASVMAAASRFMTKYANGRYKYCTPGGALGRLKHLGKKSRGVNCADFLMKVLDEAGITHIKSSIYNSPARISGH